ncbi:MULTISPECIES: RING finger domain-containing protein [unclassified Endozoicomonas]|uniref:RING finger domain-containing protein n=1 Tax=unclassified Endozoicomonas TaxID=2644528 RepID=UPI003BB56ED8
MLHEPTKVSGCMSLLLIALSKKNNTNEFTQINEISMFPQTSAENHCLICLEDFSQEPDHALSTLKCGHAFGRSCIIKWRERDSSCPLCRQNFVLPKPDVSFINALKDEFNKTLRERRGFVFAFMYSGFFLATDLEQLAYYNAGVVAVNLFVALAERCVSKVSNVISVYFGRLGTQNFHCHTLQEIAAVGVTFCSLINAGWLGRKLLLGF